MIIIISIISIIISIIIAIIIIIIVIIILSRTWSAWRRLARGRPSRSCCRASSSSGGLYMLCVYTNHVIIDVLCY